MFLVLIRVAITTKTLWWIFSFSSGQMTHDEHRSVSILQYSYRYIPLFL